MILSIKNILVEYQKCIFHRTRVHYKDVTTIHLAIWNTLDTLKESVKEHAHHKTLPTSVTIPKQAHTTNLISSNHNYEIYIHRTMVPTVHIINKRSYVTLNYLEQFLILKKSWKKISLSRINFGVAIRTYINTYTNH